MGLKGTIPNQKGRPVVQEWVAVQFQGTGLKVTAVEPFEAVAERLQLGRKAYANSNAPIPDSLKQQRQVAVDSPLPHLPTCRDRRSDGTQLNQEAHRHRLRHLRSRQVEQPALAYPVAPRRPQHEAYTPHG